MDGSMIGWMDGFFSNLPIPVHFVLFPWLQVPGDPVGPPARCPLRANFGDGGKRL